MSKIPRSFAKIYYSYGRLTQDDDFLPYTTNQAILMSLPQASLDAEIIAQNLLLKLNHWFNPNWSLHTRYNYRDRYNKTNSQGY